MIYNFIDLPGEDYFDKIFSVTDHASIESPLEARNTAVRQTAHDAMKFSQDHPDVSTGCRMSFSYSNYWIAPISADMRANEISKMCLLVLCGEIVSKTARMFGEEESADFYDENFQRAAQEIGREAPEALRRFNNACKDDDFNGIHGSLLELHIAALNQMEDLYGRSPKFITKACSDTSPAAQRESGRPQSIRHSIVRPRRHQCHGIRSP